LDGVAGAGAAGGAGGACGTDIGAGARLVTLELPERLDNSVRKREVQANMMARPVVTFFMKLEPVGVVIRESPLPPKRESPAPRPVCKRTTRIISRQATMCKVRTIT
jgi:hypothetical protein